MSIYRPEILLRGGLYLMLCLVLSINFQVNLLQIAPPDFFENFQLNGQARVLGGIVADEHDLDKQGANFGKVYRRSAMAGPPSEAFTIAETYLLYEDFPVDEVVQVEPYRAQFGLQALVYSYLRNRLGVRDLADLQYVSSFLLAVSIVVLFALYRKIYDNLFAWLFLLCLAFSPWLVSMARNIYWNPFLFFLPAVFAALLYGENRPSFRVLYLLLIAASVFIKSLSNYEYLTTVTLLASSVFLVGPYFEKDRSVAAPDFAMAGVVFVCCVAGFALAFLMHAGLRGDTLSDGMREIVEKDVFRRTFGDASQFNHRETQQSLDATVLDVLRIYVFEWPTRRLMLVPGKVFWALNILALLGIGYKAVTRHPTARRDLVMFVTFLSVPVSWFVFAKGHSYTQTHINFVLWYIGFLPALLYVAWQSVAVMLARMSPLAASNVRSPK